LSPVVVVLPGTSSLVGAPRSNGEFSTIRHRSLKRAAGILLTQARDARRLPKREALKRPCILGFWLRGLALAFAELKDR